MFLRKLKVENIRNLAVVDVEPFPGLNVVYGSNGAGKTSLLEAIVVLSRGRSFRTNQATELIGPKGDVFRVFSESCHKNDITHRLGVERSSRHWRARKDGVELTQLSQLTRDLPLVLMEPNSHLLVSGTPEFRRKYLDWGMFHVKQEFLDIHRQYSKILKQRNAALRFQKEDLLDSIDDVLIKLGVRLGEYRKQHFEAISSRVTTLLYDLNPKIAAVELFYNNGWKSDSFELSLRDSRKRDLVRGVTGNGPHRADISIKKDGVEARTVLSRGEQKVLSAAFLLAQGQVLGREGDKPILLLDDLASEFDQKNFERVLDKSMDCGDQVWITGARNPNLDFERKVFHVERGLIQEMV